MMRSDLDRTWEELVSVLSNIGEEGLGKEIYSLHVEPCMLNVNHTEGN